MIIIWYRMLSPGCNLNFSETTCLPIKKCLAFKSSHMEDEPGTFRLNPVDSSSSTHLFQNPRRCGRPHNTHGIILMDAYQRLTPYSCRIWETWRVGPPNPGEVQFGNAFCVFFFGGWRWVFIWLTANRANGWDIILEQFWLFGCDSPMECFTS